MIEIGTIKENPSKDFKSIAGMQLLLISLEEDCQRIIITPMTQGGFEKYYEAMFEIMGKEWISEDYKHFLNYMLDGSCEFIAYISVEDLADIRLATEEDVIEHGRVLKEFIDKHELKIKN